MFDILDQIVSFCLVVFIAFIDVGYQNSRLYNTFACEISQVLGLSNTSS